MADPQVYAQIGDRPLVLVGMMGAGKSAVGRRLAQKLGRAFFDSDREIEKAAGMSIAEIFVALGEPRFRDAEARLAARLLETPRCVVALGGGAFLHPDTRRLIGACGVSIWLDARCEVLATRLRRRDTRPLLKGEDLDAILRRLDAARRPIYAEADLHILSDEGRPDAMVEKICAGLLDRLPKNTILGC